VPYIPPRKKAEASKFYFTHIEIDVTVLGDIPKRFILNALAYVNIPIHSFIFYAGSCEPHTMAVIYQLSAQEQFDIHIVNSRSIALAN
jgi:hypothetical protein